MQYVMHYGMSGGLGSFVRGACERALRIHTTAFGGNLYRYQDHRDREIAPLVAAEKLFNFCDETDFAILSLLAAGKTYENAADVTFLTVGGVKYRLKRMANAVGAESAKALLELAEKSGMFRS